MRLSPSWITSSKALFAPEDGHFNTGHAYLTNYTASYREWGDGPPLVLVPGLAGGIDLVGPLARELAKHFRVIAFQLRGEDDCFALRRRFGLKDMVADLIEFIDWHGLEQPDVLGVSFGGVLALEAAMRHPHRFRSLSLQGVGARFESGLVKLVASLALADFPLPTRNDFVNQFFQLLLGKGPQPRDLIDAIARQCWQTDQAVMTHRFRMIRRLNFTPRLDCVKIPVLAMAAEKDLLVSDSNLQELGRKLPDATTVRLRRGGHLSFVLDPVCVANEVIRFSKNLC
jgi:pimeloyl-ACP methyl ester carboxylesterase